MHGTNYEGECMALRVAINGFGRIGRTFLRVVLQDPQARQALTVMAINIGPAQRDMVAHMVQYDSIMGMYPETVHMQDNQLVIGDYAIDIITELDPATIDWKRWNIDWVVEASGHFTKREGALKHLHAGARRVLITAPAHGEDITIIPGVNDQQLDLSKHALISLGSCTTNAYIPTLKILNDAFGIECSCMTTVHAYTNTQVLLDVEENDSRRARAAALNIIPTSTGAMKVVEKVMPELRGKVQGMALRVPVAIVSLLDLSFITTKEVTIDAINRTFVQASAETLKGIVGVTDEPLVSSDFRGNSHSVIIDSQLTSTCGPAMGKVFGWYDNEWGYSARLKDFLISVVGRSM